MARGRAMGRRSVPVLQRQQDEQEQDEQAFQGKPWGGAHIVDAEECTPGCRQATIQVQAWLTEDELNRGGGRQRWRCWSLVARRPADNALKYSWSDLFRLPAQRAAIPHPARVRHTAREIARASPVDRIDHQRHLPGRPEEIALDVLVFPREEETEIGMRMVPADNLQLGELAIFRQGNLLPGRMGKGQMGGRALGLQSWNALLDDQEGRAIVLEALP